MSPVSRKGKVSRALKYIIKSASNYFVKYNLARYKKFIPQTKWKRWMLAGYALCLTAQKMSSQESHYPVAESFNGFNVLLLACTSTPSRGGARR